MNRLKSKLLFSTMLVLLIILGLMFYYSHQETESSIPTYTAAVVEYRPVSPMNFNNSEDYMVANAIEYGKLMEEAKKSDVDIIVFPEHGLIETDFVRPSSMPIGNFCIEIPEPSTALSSFEAIHTSNSKILRYLTAAAKSSNLYAVINLPEKVNCTSTDGCPQSGFFCFNANIVIDRKGRIVARYRKFNLYAKNGMIREKEANVCTFNTDFGVEFGMFICFDILFENPALRLITEKQVSDVIFSTAWMTELPFLTASAVQTAWAYSMDVNFLASGYNNPFTGSGGSGIFNGKKEALTTTMNDGHMTRLLIAKVPIKRYSSDTSLEKYTVPAVGNSTESSEPLIISNTTLDTRFRLHEQSFYKSESLGNFRYKIDKDIINMKSELLSPPANSTRHKIRCTTFDYSSEEFNASVKVRWHINGHYSKNEPRYRLISYSGKKLFIDYEKISLAGLTACKDEDVLSCGFMPNFLGSSVKTTINSVEIRVRSRFLTLGYLPITLDSNLKQLPTNSYTFTKRMTHESGVPSYEVKMSLLKPVKNLLAFVIFRVITH